MKKTQRYLFLILPCLLLAASLHFFKANKETIDSNLKSEHFQNSLADASDLVPNHNEMEPKAQIPQIGRSLLLGKVDASSNPLFVKVHPHHANREGIYLLSEVYEAFKTMQDAAKRDGVRLIIMSGFRNFEHQKRIWNNKWNGSQLLEGNIKATEIVNEVERITEILKYSAMPGTSRHHWGTDIDLNSLSNSYFESGQGKKILTWLKENAADFGFYQPYTKFGESRNRGHMEENWHWTYLPISKKYFEAYIETVTYEDLQGFGGDYLAKKVEVIENYVMGINREILDRETTQR
jgi:LAS superfamily LD-carboxypeptidase LdcB